MKLRATITIDFEAIDFLDAGNQQQTLDKLVQYVAAAHPAYQVTFGISELNDASDKRMNNSGRKKPPPKII